MPTITYNKQDVICVLWLFHNFHCTIYHWCKICWAWKLCNMCNSMIPLQNTFQTITWLIIGLKWKYKPIDWWMVVRYFENDLLLLLPYYTSQTLLRPVSCSIISKTIGWDEVIIIKWIKGPSQEWQYFFIWCGTITTSVVHALPQEAILSCPFIALSIVHTNNKLAWLQSWSSQSFLDLF